MLKNKKIFFFDTINLSILPYVIYKKLCNNTVFFYRIDTKQFGFSVIIYIVNKFNIKIYNHLNKNPKNYIDTFDLKYKLVEKYFVNNNLNSFIDFFSKKIQLDCNGKKKLEYLFKNQLFKNNIDQDFAAYKLILDLSKENNVHYYPSNLNTYLLLKNELIFNTSRLLFIFISISSYFNFLKSLNFSLPKFKYTLKKRVHSKDPKIGFVPHKNFTYGSFYKKNYIFDKNPKSIFYKTNILNIFDAPLDHKSSRYVRLNNLNTYFINYSLKDFIKIFFSNFKFIRSIFTKFSKNIFLALFISEICIRILVSNKIVKRDLNINKVIIHYDVLVSPFFLISCHINSIKTFAIQERPLQYIYFKYYFFDYYFTIGSFFNALLEKNSFLANNYIDYGFSRSLYGKFLINKYQHLNLSVFKNKSKNFLFLGSINSNDYNIGPNAEYGSSKKSNLRFFNSIYEISKFYNDVSIHIKFKDHSIFSDPFFNQIISDIKSLNNTFLYTSSNSMNSYLLCYHSDLIICKYSSLVDQMLSIGKKVLIDDSENYISNFNYYLSKEPITITSSDDLLSTIKNISKIDYSKYESFFTQNDSYSDYYYKLKNFISIC